VWNPHQRHHHKKEHECDAAALYNPVSPIIFEKTPERDSIQKEKPYASHHRFRVSRCHVEAHSTPKFNLGKMHGVAVVSGSAAGLSPDKSCRTSANWGSTLGAAFTEPCTIPPN
jgi:hypothetical protein